MTDKIFNIAAAGPHTKSPSDVLDMAIYRLRNLPHADFYEETINETLQDVVLAYKVAEIGTLDEGCKRYVHMVARRGTQLGLEKGRIVDNLNHIADNCGQIEILEDLAIAKIDDLQKASGDDRDGPKGLTLGPA